MSDTHIWTATISGVGACNARIDPSSVFYTGPFAPSTRNKICDLYIRNAGNREDRIRIKVYEYPREPREQIIADLVTDRPVSPGSMVQVSIELDVPNQPGDWPLGVKVWCETQETEPPWG